MTSRKNSSRFRFRLITRKALYRLATAALLFAGFLVWGYFQLIVMPGESWSGPLPELTESQEALAENLQNDVTMLATTIGPRNTGYPEQLRQTEQWIEAELRIAGYVPKRHVFTVTDKHRALKDFICANIEAELPGQSLADEIVIIGAHFDSAYTAPGANDNGSGVAAVLALAEMFAGTLGTPENPGDQPQRTLRFVLFTNEEPPFFQTQHMGSLVYAKRCLERNENIVAMLSLETIGYFSDVPGSQQYPPPLGMFYPDQGNFITFVSNIGSRKLVKQCIATFRNNVQFPSEGSAPYGGLPGVGWSDQWAFWKQGYPAIMITDTAPFRYPDYHHATDTPDKLDYERMARVVEGLKFVVDDLVNPGDD